MWVDGWSLRVAEKPAWWEKQWQLGAEVRNTIGDGWDADRSGRGICDKQRFVVEEMSLAAMDSEYMLWPAADGDLVEGLPQVASCMAASEGSCGVCWTQSA